MEGASYNHERAPMEGAFYNHERAPMEGASYKSIKEGVGTPSSVSAFNHERVPMSCLQQLNALEANN